MEDFDSGDTDMATPQAQENSQAPSHSHSQSQSQSQPQSHATESQSAAETKSTKPKTRKLVRDGYVYQPYDTYTHSSKDTLDFDGEFVPSSKNSSNNNKDSHDHQASATRILELRGLERRIVQLLETAGQAIQILSGDPEDDENDEAGQRLLSATSLQPAERNAMVKAYADEKSQKFETLAAGYATLVNEIQSGLRRQFHYLTKAGISSSQVPFKNVVYGEEKELETWLNAVDVLKDSADRLIGNVEQELLKPQESAEGERGGGRAGPETGH
ncbi:hypothetical protein BGZ70_003248 [Mortierella alpina]|uniref:Mediator of RNA polymerase II transcription subunit 11 n=1 Tax=Mortierella alpina TaxID=64518 RepID=A0A9P6JAT5_MORAP|nr:hypothetical protein BGZ70_003248 [Mortierella alpina]